MKFLYATDLHGNHSYYKKLLKVAKERRVEAIIFGGDLFPKNPLSYENQRHFIQDFLENWAVKVLKNNISIYWMLGNDDLRSIEPFFIHACNRIRDRAVVANKREEAGQPIGGIKYIADNRCQLWGTDYKIVGFPYVTDYPFGLKDWCLYDYDGWKPEKYISLPVVSEHPSLEMPENFSALDNPEQYFKSKGTMRQHLQRLPRPRDWRKTIFVCHEPPTEMGLDVTARGKCVGSHSVKQFIEFHRPYLTLHGHIHESPEVSGIWHHINDEHGEETISIQPGDKHFVYIEIDEDPTNVDPLVMKRIAYK